MPDPPLVPAATIVWLLEPADPPVRYLALRQLLHRSARDPDVVAARKAIPSARSIERLMRGQAREGYWVNPDNCYLPKLNATVWRLQLLAELGMPAEDPRIQRACDRFLGQNTMPDGGFTCSSRANRKRYSEECVTGHMVYTLRRLGRGPDPLVRVATRWIIDHQRDDGGWNCDHRPDSRHSSFLSTLAAMKALAAVPERERDGRHRRAIARAIDFLLAHRLFWSHRDPQRLAQGRRPFRLRFPAHYAYDLLQAPRVLAMLNVGPDPRLDQALSLLEQKRDEHWRWRVDTIPLPPSGNLRGALRVDPEGRPSKWLTLHAITVLAHFRRASLPRSSAVPA